MTETGYLLAADAGIDGLWLAIRMAHIFAAVLAAGGALFQWMALAPSAAATLDEGSLSSLRERVAGRWRAVTFTCIALLLVSGFANFFLFKLKEFDNASNAGLYHGLFGLKFLLSLGAFWIATMLVMRGPRGERARQRTPRHLRALAFHFAAILVIAVVLRSLTPAYA